MNSKVGELLRLNLVRIQLHKHEHDSVSHCCLFDYCWHTYIYSTSYEISQMGQRQRALVSFTALGTVLDGHNLGTIQKLESYRCRGLCWSREFSYCLKFLFPIIFHACSKFFLAWCLLFIYPWRVINHHILPTLSWSYKLVTQFWAENSC